MHKNPLIISGDNSANAKVISLALCLLLLLGLFTRGYNLSLPVFHYDELYHVFAAKSLLTDGTPNLPSGTPYTRSLYVTQIGALLFKYFGVSEAIARVPSILISILVAFLIWRLSKTYIGSRAALISSALYLFSPWCIELSRSFRYYSFTQLYYLCSFFILLTFFRKSYDIRPFIRDTTPLKQLVSWKSITLVALLGVMLLLGWRDNKLMFVLFPSFGFIVAARLVIFAATNGVRKTLFSTDVLITAIAGISFIVLLIVSPLTVKNIYWQAIQVPGWALDRAEDHLYYLRFLFTDYPLYPFFFSVGSYLLCKRSGWAGACVVAAVLIPLILLSTVINWRTARYMSHLMPLFYIVMAVGMVATLEWAASICKWLPRETPISFNDNRFKQIVIVSLTTLYLLLVPWTARILDVISSPEGVYQIRNNFRTTAEYYRSHIHPDDVVVVTVQPLMLAYYLGRNADYMIVEHWGKKIKHRTNKHRSGALSLFDLNDVTALFANHKRGWIFVEKDQWENGTLFKQLRHSINKNTRLMENKEVDSILVFAWDAEQAAPE